MNLTFIRYKERRILLIMDFIAFVMAHYMTYMFRFKTGLFENPRTTWWVLAPALVTSSYWLILFALRGQYRPLYGLSRLDSLWNSIKTTSFGIFLIFFVLMLDNEPLITKGKVTMVVYWALLILFAGGGRVILRTIQHSLLLRGVALSPTLIAGFNDRGKRLLDQTIKYPAMGHKVIGFVDAENIGAEYKGVKVLGSIDDLPVLIPQNCIMEVLIALRQDQEDLLEKIIAFCGHLGARLKIMPQLSQIIIGQVKSQGIYGAPLIEVFPELLQPWERWLKRLIDITVSLIILTVNIPVMLLIALIIKLDSKGAAIYSQKRVGRKGKEFTLYKFRSMIDNAEAKTGAVWAGKDDPRITRAGRFMRKSRLDELPQFFNVLKGNMSLVGPRPERKIFVDKFIDEIPLYSRRLNVKPGITGWAQVKHKYDESLDDVKVKLSYDLHYLENISTRFDLKILLLTIEVMLRGKGQ